MFGAAKFVRIEVWVSLRQKLLPVSSRACVLTYDDGSLRLSVAARTISYQQRCILGRHLTFKMEQHIRLIVLEHLRHQFDIHVLDIDFLASCQIPMTHMASHMASNISLLVDSYSTPSQPHSISPAEPISFVFVDDALENIPHW